MQEHTPATRPMEGWKNWWSRECSRILFYCRIHCHFEMWMNTNTVYSYRYTYRSSYWSSGTWPAFVFLIGWNKYVGSKSTLSFNTFSALHEITCNAWLWQSMDLWRLRRLLPTSRGCVECQKLMFFPMRQDERICCFVNVCNRGH